MASNVATAPMTPAVRFIKYWLPVLLMIGLMFYASTDVFSGDNTRTMLERILLWLAEHASARTIARLNFLVRKTAHFTEYAVLALLLFRAFKADSRVGFHVRWALYTLAVCMGWALLDELHQRFTHTRGASIYDSMLDSTGSVFALIVIGLFGLWRQRARKRAL
jgi:VanZ family protein